ncbi:MAG: hypothetical protein WBP56_10895 [Polyangia bacterium]
MIVKALAWPVAAVVLGLMFRGQVRRLLGELVDLVGRVRHVEGPGWKADLDLVKAELAQEKEALAKTETDKGRTVTVATDATTANRRGRRQREVMSNPTAAILNSWNDLERFWRDMAMHTGLPSGDFREISAHLVEKGVIPLSVQTTALRLYVLRDGLPAAVGRVEPEAAREVAEEYVSLISDVMAISEHYRTNRR